MRRTLWIPLTVLSLLLALLVAPAAGASAVRHRDRTTAAAAARHQRIVDYWTPQRRASARPRDIVLPLGTRPKGGKAAGASSAGDTTGAKWTGGGSVAVTTGKVFFTSGGTRYVCSGSAVDSSHGNLVLTAGHCAHDGGPNGSMVTNWVFYPRYDSGPDPVLGGFTATKLQPTDDWMSRANAFENDAAFARVTSTKFATLEGALAAQGAAAPQVAFSRPESGTRYHAFGYPAARKYDGRTLIYCAGPVSLGVDGRDTLSIACNMTGGSSGGPWLRDWDDAAKTGTVNSLNSYGYSAFYKNRMFGPIFDSQERAAYNAAG